MSEPNNRWMTKAGPVMALPFLVPISVAIGYGLGWWLDSKLGTKPWLADIGGILGFAAGIYESAVILMKATRNDDE